VKKRGIKIFLGHTEGGKRTKKWGGTEENAQRIKRAKGPVASLRKRKGGHKRKY